MKIFCSVLIIVCLFSCQKNIEFDNSYYKLTVPKNYIIDSTDCGLLEPSKYFYSNKTTLPGSSNIHEYYISKSDKITGIGKMITAHNLVIEIGSTLDSTIFIKQLNKNKDFYSKNQFESSIRKYEIKVNPRDTIINKLPGFYAISQYEYIKSKNINKHSLMTIWLQKKGRIHEFQLTNSDSEEFSNDFNELGRIMSSIIIK